MGRLLMNRGIYCRERKESSELGFGIYWKGGTWELC